MTVTVDLSPAVIDLILYSGDGSRFRVTITDKDDAPVDVTGGVKAQIRHKRGESNPAEADFDVDLTDAADGVVILSLTGEQTQALAPTKKFSGFWDFQWTPAGSEPRTLVQGRVEVFVDVTR